MMVMKYHLLQVVSKLIAVGIIFSIRTRCLIATTSWHAYDQDLVLSRSLLPECQMFQNSTIPQHYSSRSSRGHKTYHSMGLWPGNSNTQQIAETFCNDVQLITEIYTNKVSVILSESQCYKSSLSSDENQLLIVSSNSFIAQGGDVRRNIVWIQGGHRGEFFNHKTNCPSTTYCHVNHTDYERLPKKSSTIEQWL